MTDGGVGTHDELRLVSVGDIQVKFLVPAYQRGYRWGKEQVNVLLEDLNEIKDKNYCLQPVVVKRLPDGRFELIDGQQRLTTLYLLFLYMQKEGFKKHGPPFAIEYSTRPKSGAFLANPDAQTANENIDFFHLFGALDAIKTWFAEHGNRTEFVAGKMYGHLFERVKVIWYEHQGEDAAGLFARLNVGRIALTNAELVKALLLAKDRADHRRQIEIATQWDSIERDLHDRDFWSFLSNSPGESYPTRIQLLFDLIAETPAGADQFHTFFHFKRELATRSADVIWGEVSACYAQLKEWYEDRDLYHHIGFLIATGRGGELATLIRESKDKRKSVFQAELAEKIRARLGLTAEDLAELEYEDREKCSRVLLLFNVETTRTLKNSLERYPFAPSKNQSWSLEHIHAQNAERLNKKHQWEAWLREHVRALEVLRRPDQEASAHTQLLRDIEDALQDVTKEAFAHLSVRITELFDAAESGEDLHAIANLTLLSSEANSTLSNAVFEVKRQRILQMDRRGEYIPICTRRVFLKYYTDAGDQQLQFWSIKDREGYLTAMRTILDPYLTRSGE